MLIFWILFNIFVAAMLVLDLGVFHQKHKVLTFKQAAIGSLFWILLAVAFGVVVFFWQGGQKSLEFTTGYLIEEALSIDNLFVFLILFRYFKVPPEEQYGVLFWGIIGALVMRFTFIFAGIGLLRRFHFIVYIFGLLLIYSGVQLALGNELEVDPQKNLVLKMFRRFLPVSEDYVGGKFLVKRNGLWIATPLLAVLIVVETTDLLFAIDSIPAVLAITRDAFIVYTSNVFAILGLRALYFALSGMFDLFHLLHYGLSAVLVFVGVKMLIAEPGLSIAGVTLRYDFSTPVSLGIVGGILLMSVIASLAFPQKNDATPV